MCRHNKRLAPLGAVETAVVGYFPNWAVYWRHYYAFKRSTVEDKGVSANFILAPYYTPIQLAFANIRTDGICVVSDPSIDFTSQQSQDTGGGKDKYRKGTFS